MFAPGSAGGATIVRISKLLERLRPTDAEIRELARRETRPELASKFEPIARGPLFAIAALIAIGLAALPSLLVRLLLRTDSRRRDEEPRP